MKKFLLTLSVSSALLLGAMGLVANANAGVCDIYQGCTGRASTAQGDLLVGTSSLQSLGILHVGANGYVLTASSSAPTGLAWAQVSGGSGTVGPSTSTYVAVFNASGTVTGYIALHWTPNSTQGTLTVDNVISAGANGLEVTGNGNTLQLSDGGSNNILVGMNGIEYEPSFSSGTIFLDPVNGYTASLDTSLLSGNQNFQFPNASGVFCLTTTCLTTSTNGTLTSSSPWFPGGEIYLNSNGTVSASSSFFVSTSTGNVSVQSLENVVYADQFPGSDMGAKINNAYAALPSGGGTIYVPAGAYQFSTKIVFATAGKVVQLVGAGGGGFYNAGATSLQYTPSTGVAITYNVANYSSAGIGFYNFSLFGPAGVGNAGSSSLPTTPSSTVSYGMYLGGGNGATGVNVQGVNVAGFGQGILFGANTFLTNINLSAIQKDGILLNYLQSSNADENNKITNSLLADSQFATSSPNPSIADDGVYLNNNISADWNITGNSFDDTQIAIAESGTGNTAVHINNNHFESPNEAGTGCYDFVTSNSGQSAHLSLYSSGNDYLQNGSGAGSSCAEYVSNGGMFSSSGDNLGMYSAAASSTIRFVTNLDNADIVSWVGLTTTGGAKNVYAYGNNLISSQGFGSGSNSPVFSATGTTFQFPNLTVGKFLALDGNGNVVTTGTPSGGAGGGIASTTPFTVGYLPVVSSSLALTNSVISQNGTTTTIAASTTNIGSATTTFQIFSNGHINSTGTVAQVSSCGSTPSIRGTDVAGEVTDGSGTDTSCTVTFQYAYGAKPIVTVTPETAGISNFGYSYTTSTITVTATSLTSDVWDYIIYAHE